MLARGAGGGVAFGSTKGGLVKRVPSRFPIRFPAPGSWRLEPSIVTAVKRAYREGSKAQRCALKAWMTRVVNGEDAP